MPTEQLRGHTATDGSAGQTGLGDASRRLSRRATRGPRPRWPSSLTKQMVPLGASTRPWDAPLLAGLTDASSGDRGHHPLGVAHRAFATQTTGRLSTAQSSYLPKRLRAFGAQMFGYFSIFKEKAEETVSKECAALLKKKMSRSLSEFTLESIFGAAKGL